MNDLNIIRSLKINLTVPYSRISEAGRSVLKHAQLRDCVELNRGGSWIKNRNEQFNEDVVYRIIDEYRG